MARAVRSPRCIGRAVEGIVLLGTLIGACVRAAPGAPGGDRNFIGEDAIAAMRVASAYDVVARTRAEFLRGRGRESLDPRVPSIPVHVFVDNTYYGDVSVLRTIPASQLAGIRFYQGYEAQQKFGSGHMGGVIQLITKL